MNNPPPTTPNLIDSDHGTPPVLALRPKEAARSRIERDCVTGDRLISVKAAADLLDCSGRQVWKLLASGRLPRPVRLGRSVRWRKNDILRFIAAGCDMRAFDAEREAVGAGRGA